MVIDAHQHFWDVGCFNYRWMAPDRKMLNRSFLPEDLRPLIAKAGVVQTLVVQAHCSVEEAFWLLKLASVNDFIGGVVAWVDLASANVAYDLDDLGKSKYFKGVRHPIEDEADDGWVIRPEVLRGLAELERRKIPFDLLVWPRHLKYVPMVRDRCPGLRLVVDHIAKPSIADGTMSGWAYELEAVADLPDTWCKLSGMITLASWESWRPADLKPYVDRVLELFGFDRVMFGSDWPVCTLAGSYQDVVNALRFNLRQLTEQESMKVWGENATTCYQL